MYNLHSLDFIDSYLIIVICFFLASWTEDGNIRNASRVITIRSSNFLAPVTHQALGEINTEGNFLFRDLLPGTLEFCPATLNETRPKVAEIQHLVEKVQMLEDERENLADQLSGKIAECNYLRRKLDQVSRTDKQVNEYTPVLSPKQETCISSLPRLTLPPHLETIPEND